MQFVLLLAGVLALLVGAAAVGLGVLELRHGGGSSGLMQTGVLTSVGGFVVLGLGAVIARLQKLADLLETRPVPLNFGAPVAPPLPPLPPRLVPEREVPPLAPPHAILATAPEVAPPLREPPAVAPEPPPPAEPVPTQEPPPLAAAVSPPGPAGPPAPAAWPTVTPSDRIAPAEAAEPDPLTQPVAEPPAGVPAEAAGPPREPLEVLKTGVIEGMAYTIYSDGTVDAELPEGTIRFASVTAWREHLRPGG